MTTANKITILRILLIPFFVVEVLYYAQNGHELHRILAIVCFAVAAICDGVDGYVARRFNQRSELGAILDPLADKLLLVSGIVVLSFDHAPYLESVPLWLTGTIIGRDILILIGMVVIQLMVGKVKVRPRIVGKVATVLANGRRALDYVEVAGELAARSDPCDGHLHRHLGAALCLGRQPPVERAPVFQSKAQGLKSKV